MNDGLALALGAAGGLVSTIAFYEYQGRRERKRGKAAAVREVGAAFGDLRSYWVEATPHGINAAERDNLLAAIDIFRDTLLRHSSHFAGPLLAEIQGRAAALRGVITRLPLDQPNNITAVQDHLSSLAAIVPVER